MRRWHPDKYAGVLSCDVMLGLNIALARLDCHQAETNSSRRFVQAFGHKLFEDHKLEIMERVKATFVALNDAR